MKQMRWKPEIAPLPWKRWIRESEAAACERGVVIPALAVSRSKRVEMLLVHDGFVLARRWDG